MLAKQFWRLLVSPESLVGQVLPAHYYPGSSILDAELGSRPSFTWRSILSSKALIRVGYQWRIGDGRTGRIWIDPWIPRQPSFRPQSVLTPLPPPTTNRLNIPQSSSMNSPTLKNGWQRTWNAKVPNKVRIFAWRLGTNSLPLGPNLSRRIPGIDVLCPLCQAPEEIDKHTFLLCPFARMVWALSDLRWDVISAWPSTARDWIFYVNQKLDKSDFNLFLVICWSIWWCRNQRWAQNEVVSVSPEQTIAFARNYLSAFSGDIGIGVIARDSQGQCLAWTALRIHKNILPATAEAWAARIAIQFAARHGWPNIVLEVDSAPLHVQLATFSDRLSNIGPIVHDTLASFSHCSFSLVRRSANVVAHTLARNAVGNEEGTNILPFHSCNLVLADLPS
ncbi:UNVERIFIED_CONTAM: putative mitochondrial protein [Sesamum latifolium]|uniref:Mitochondrial protein n=1 Tax=Sesamum latifolium TaxID=2727402 RepID=A0AAW2VTC7_9LAMI